MHAHRHLGQRHWQHEWAIGHEERAWGWWRHDGGAVGPDERDGAETAVEAGELAADLLLDEPPLHLLADDLLAPRRGLPLERRGRRRLAMEGPGCAGAGTFRGWKSAVSIDLWMVGRLPCGGVKRQSGPGQE